MAKYKELDSLQEFDFYDGTFKSIENHVFMRLFNQNSLPKNYAIDSVPHSIRADLAITYSVEKKTFINKQKIIGCYMLTNEDIAALQVDNKTLNMVASINLNNKNSARIDTIQNYSIRSHVMHPLTTISSEASIMIESKQNSSFPSKEKKGTLFSGELNQLPIICNKEDKKDVLVISNRTQTFAAINFMSSDILEFIYNCFMEDFYIIPSSVHEVLCIRKGYAKKNGQLTTKQAEEELEDMTEQINETINDDNLILSYNVYYYSHEDYCTIII